MSDKQEKRKNGKRNSQWEVFDRCLRLLMRLMRGPADNAELKEIIANHAAQKGEDIGIKALERRLEEDRLRLRHWFYCELDYDPINRTYTLLDIKRPLLDLPPEGMQALAFLRANFGKNAPMASELDILTNAITQILPSTTRRQIEKQRRILELETLVRDDDDISEKVWSDIELTTAEKRILVFDYLSPRNTDGARMHRVEPTRYYVQKGHYYLEAYCQEIVGPYGRIDQKKYFEYRIGRISNTCPMPDHFLPRRRRGEELVYILAPQIARSGVTTYFKDHQAISRPDGSVEVRALSHNLFTDLRMLLHYGPNCQVIGGDEAVTQMRKLIREMADIYKTTDESPSL